MKVKIFLSVISLLLVGNSSRADNYHNPARHFSLVLPDNWVLMAPQTLAAINEFAGQRLAQMRYEAGFQLKDQAPGSYPYILVQIHSQRTAGFSFDQIESGFAKSRKEAIKQVEGALSDIASKLALDTVLVDRSKNRLIMPMEMEVAFVGRIKGISIGTIGSEGVVFLHCYATQADFPLYLPSFNTITDSFRFDPGYTYLPSASTVLPGPGWDWPGAVAGGIVGGIIGVIIAGFGFLFRKLFKRKGS